MFFNKSITNSMVLYSARYMIYLLTYLFTYVVNVNNVNQQ